MEIAADIGYPLTPASEIADRIRRLQAQLATADLDGVLVVQNVDLLYFTGTMQNAHLYVPREGEAAMFVFKTLSRAQAESPLRDIVPLRSPKELPALLAERGHRPMRLGLEMDVLPASSYLNYQRIFSGLQLADGWPAIRATRMVKSGWEVACLERAAAISDAMIAAVQGVLKPGVSELVAAAAGEYAGRLAGHGYNVRMRGLNNELAAAFVSSGPNGAIPTAFLTCNGGLGLSPAYGQGASNRLIQANEPILTDYVGLYNGYIADQTRTLVLDHLPADLQRAYQATVQVQEAMVAVLKLGVLASEVYRVGLAAASELGYAAHLQGFGEQQVAFIGHAVGLELNEWPAIAKGVDEPLQAGMVIALEPKLAFVGRGMVGVENSWLLTDGAPRRLTNLSETVGDIAG